MTYLRNLQFGELFNKFKDTLFTNHDLFTVGLVHDLIWVYENNVEDRFPSLYCEECRRLTNFVIQMLMKKQLIGDVRISRRQAYDKYKKNKNPLVDMNTFMNNREWFAKRKKKYPAAS